jgi:hypothetical protein
MMIPLTRRLPYLFIFVEHLESAIPAGVAALAGVSITGSYVVFDKYWTCSAAHKSSSTTLGLKGAMPTADCSKGSKGKGN